MATRVDDQDACHLLSGLGHPDRAAAAIAERQLSVISARQLALVGLRPHAVAGRVARAQLTRIFHGVYRWGNGAPPPGALEFAACLVCGPNAWASGASGTWLWQVAAAPEAVEITVAGTRHRSRAGLVVHCVRKMDPADVTEVRGIPVVAPAWALLELAARDRGDALPRAVSDALARQLVTEREIEACLDRAAGRPGAPALRALLANPIVTRSEAERLLLRLIRDAGLPRPRTNVLVAGKRVDAWWPEHNLVVEFDGYGFHGHRLAFEADRATDQRLVAAGYRVMRITWRQLTGRPLRVAANLAAALARAK